MRKGVNKMKEVKNIINNFEGEVYDLCYKLLEDEANEKVVFEYVCLNLLELPENTTIHIKKYFTEEEINEYKLLYGDLINGLIRSTIKRCDYGMLQPKEFYNNLWQSYCVNFTTLKEKAFAFYYTLIDKRIPYIYIGKPLSMEQSRYEKLVDENEEILNKINYIFKSAYLQKTEMSSLILQCLDNIDDFEIKVIALIRALELYSNNRKMNNINIGDLIEKINKKISESQQDGN